MRNGHTADGAVLEILARDPVWAAYAIADLRPDLSRHCRWLVAQDASGLALIFSGLQPPVLLTAGSPEGVGTALTGADLPGEVFLSVLPSHLPVIAHHYPRIAPCDMLRMALPPNRTVTAPALTARRLAPADEHPLSALYQHGGDYAPDAFDPNQLKDGFFFGIDDEAGALAAAGGTHVACRRASLPPTDAGLDPSPGLRSLELTISQGVAAIGNIYTRPDRRGLGYGRAITTTVTRALQEDGFSLIVLNVDERNLVAKSIYEKLGFDVHCHFIEGFARMIR